MGDDCLQDDFQVAVRALEPRRRRSSRHLQPELLRAGAHQAVCTALHAREPLHQDVLPCAFDQTAGLRHTPLIRLSQLAAHSLISLSSLTSHDQATFLVSRVAISHHFTQAAASSRSKCERLADPTMSISNLVDSVSSLLESSRRSPNYAELSHVQADRIAHSLAGMDCTHRCSLLLASAAESNRCRCCLHCSAPQRQHHLQARTSTS